MAKAGGRSGGVAVSVTKTSPGIATRWDLGSRDAGRGDQQLLVDDADGDGRPGRVAVRAERGARGHLLERRRRELRVVAERA